MGVKKSVIVFVFCDKTPGLREVILCRESILQTSAELIRCILHCILDSSMYDTEVHNGDYIFQACSSPQQLLLQCMGHDCAKMSGSEEEKSSRFTSLSHDAFDSIS